MVDTDGPEDTLELVSLAMTYRICQDKDYDSTLSNVEDGYGVSEDAECWEMKAILTSKINPSQLADDSGDARGEAKIEAIRSSIRDGVHLSPVFVIHEPDSDYPYRLIEGRHRYNARHREASKEVLAWVAHFDCCGSDGW
ncbi:ParB-like nuclease family protein [Williamsia muralis]|uniref:ParB-like nuclease family protein n=1 Tax=Williamsia marianensis TaxID=85044 RepID=A0A495IT31_WILMA|nr:ParB N-terminal domain-containing protein [Williamsia muralis]RKR79830.1 ParB-like nuclease family protein [Williamsia muralis]